jgi:uncharacterized Ntn-hydrolase superfamily protein
MKTIFLVALCLNVAVAALAAEKAAHGAKNRVVSTFSIVAADPSNGDLGIAVASRYFSVGSVVPWAEAGIGAAATQANVNVGYGPRALELLKQGLTAHEVINKLLAEDTFPGKDGRQVAVVDAKGNVAAYTGPNAPPWCGDHQGKTWSAQGNTLVGPEVVEAMGRAFDSTRGELAEKLYSALKAGDSSGGDLRGRQSASMLVVRKGGGRNINNDRYVYINVDDNPHPFEELRRLLDLNLADDYEDDSDRLLRAGKVKEARGAAVKAVRYAPNDPDSHLTLGLLNYHVGDKGAALAEILKSKSLDSNFAKRWEEYVQLDADAKAVNGDNEFLEKLFPK